MVEEVRAQRRTREAVMPCTELWSATGWGRRRGRTFAGLGLTKSYLIRSDTIMIRVIRDRLYGDRKMLPNFGFPMEDLIGRAPWRKFS